MKQTAVEWLVENLITEPYSEKDFEHNSNCWDKAKEMEKQQIIEACDNAQRTDFYVKYYDTEQYYNETFKSE
jgi:hypothetical protein